jgi:hypothetical protein
MNAGMSALTELNELRKEARQLGIEKPTTMKRDALKTAIAETKAQRAEAKAKSDAEGDPFDEIDPEIEGDHLTEDLTLGEAKAARDITREAWLLSAIEKLIPLLEQAGAANVRHRKYQVSVSFPSKYVRKRVGECWADRASECGGINNVLVSPIVDDPIQVLGTVAHELIHADDNCESGHNGHFKKVAMALGLTGKMTATEIGEDLRPVLADMVTELGTYPHTKLNLGTNQKKQGTRMLKADCRDNACACHDDKGNGYTVRLTAKWVEVGMPTCPAGTKLTLEGEEPETEEEENEDND